MTPPAPRLLTTGYFTDTNSAGQIVAPESQVIAGLQQAVNEGVNVVSESYGYGALPGANDDLLAPTNDAMVAGGRCRGRERGRQRLVRHGRGPRR